jgi:D-xylose transport system permease protein
MSSVQLAGNDRLKSLFTAARRNMRSYTMVIALVAIWLLFGALTGWVFLTPRNISNLFRQMSMIGFLACGMVLVIVTGNIDLSVGSVTGFISALVAKLQAKTLPPLFESWFPEMSRTTAAWTSTIVVVVIAMLVGLLIGAYQGTLIAYANIPAFIVTLGGWSMFRGGVLWVTEGKSVTPIEEPLIRMAQGYLHVNLGYIVAFVVIGVLFVGMIRSRARKAQYGFDLPPLYRDILKAGFFGALVLLYVFVMNQYRGVQNPVFLLAIVAVVISYASTNTRFGRYSYAIGGNKEATRLSGINIRKNNFLVFVLMGAMCGICGLVLTGYVAAGTTIGGNLYELDTIAACVMGGTSLMGGEGTIFGAIIGALVMASIINGMSVMNMPIEFQYIVKGIVLIIAVYLDVMSKRSK